ncbi:MAG: M28 family peptidase, partial [Candidatus Hydrogenedens sp.]
MAQIFSKGNIKPFTIVGIFILLLWGFYSIYDCWSPPVVPVDAPSDKFSAERAIKVLEYPTTMIHPFGSQENAKVREYLVQKLRLLGVEPEVYTGYVKRPSKHGYNSMERVDSIMVVLPGYAPTRSILLMGHYDSTPYGVGCADDGSAVATMYETLRALLHSAPLKNDVIFLFTDGEEAGLLGPRAFLKHPLFETVGLCLNFEARGHYGPSMMFQMSNNNSWLIKEFAKVVPYPRASSMMFEVAGKMPTSTDYYVLKPKGVPGFDFAFVGGIRYYHTPNDNIAHISLRSLQHHGEYALPLVKHFGNLDLSHLTIGYPFEEPINNSTYFPLPGNRLITYSEKWVLPLLFLAIFLYIVMLFSIRLFWGIHIRDVIINFVRNVVHTLLIFTVLGGLVGLTFLIYKHYIVYYELTYFVMGLLTTSGLFLIFLPIIFARFDPHVFFASALLPWLGLAIYSTIEAPTASYIPVWILLIGSTCGIISCIPYIPQKWQRSFIWLSFWTLIPTLVTIYFVTPFLILGVQTLTPIFIPILMIFLILIFYLPVGIVQNFVQNKKTCYRWGMILFVAGLLIYAYPMLFFKFTKETPKVNHLCYGLDWDTGKAWWMTRDSELDEWTEQFFKKDVQLKKPEPFTGDNIIVRFAEAPVASYPQPLLSISEDKTEG